MKESNKQVQNAVVKLSSLTGNQEFYRDLMEKESLPTIIRMIAYDLFVSEYYHPAETSDEMYSAYRTILEYANELKSNGYVVFSKRP